MASGGREETPSFARRLLSYESSLGGCGPVYIWEECSLPQQLPSMPAHFQELPPYSSFQHLISSLACPPHTSAPFAPSSLLTTRRQTLGRIVILGGAAPVGASTMSTPLPTLDASSSHPTGLLSLSASIVRHSIAPLLEHDTYKACDDSDLIALCRVHRRLLPMVMSPQLRMGRLVELSSRDAPSPSLPLPPSSIPPYSLYGVLRALEVTLRGLQAGQLAPLLHSIGCPNLTELFVAHVKSAVPFFSLPPTVTHRPSSSPLRRLNLRRVTLNRDDLQLSCHPCCVSASS